MSNEARTTGQSLDPLVRDLLSPIRSTREEALVAARAMANAGNRKGVDALAKAIRVKAGDPAIELYEPGYVLRAADECARAYGRIMDIASRRAICKEASQVAALMAMLDIRDSVAVRSLLSELRQAGGDDQAHEFQLVGTHQQAVAGYKSSSK